MVAWRTAARRRDYFAGDAWNDFVFSGVKVSITSRPAVSEGVTGGPVADAKGSPKKRLSQRFHLPCRLCNAPCPL